MDCVLLSEKNHVANCRKKLGEIYKNRRYCDIAIICSDGELQAHFLILVCYFNFLKTDGQWKPAEKMIFLPSFTKSAVEHVLDIIYLGKTRVPEKDVSKVFEVASFLKVDVERVERDDEARDPDSQTPDSFEFSVHCSSTQNTELGADEQLQASEINNGDKTIENQDDYSYGHISSSQPFDEVIQEPESENVTIQDTSVDHNYPSTSIPSTTGRNVQILSVEIIEPPNELVQVSSEDSMPPLTLESNDEDNAEIVEDSSNTNSETDQNPVSASSKHMEEQAKKQRKRCRTLETDSSEDEGQTNVSANNCQPNESTAVPDQTSGGNSSLEASVQIIEKENTVIVLSDSLSPQTECDDQSKNLSKDKTGTGSSRSMRKKQKPNSDSSKKKGKMGRFDTSIYSSTDEEELTEYCKKSDPKKAQYRRIIDNSSSSGKSSPTDNLEPPAVKYSQDEIKNILQSLYKPTIPKNEAETVIKGDSRNLKNFCVLCRKNYDKSHFAQHKWKSHKRVQCERCRQMFHNEKILQIHLPCNDLLFK